jgi:hypothetical protein
MKDPSGRHIAMVQETPLKPTPSLEYKKSETYSESKSEQYPTKIKLPLIVETQ